MRSEEIEPELKRLSRIAASVEPGLAKRLEEIRRWIKDKKPGLLNSKKPVLFFLVELVKDARFWLYTQSLTPQERQEVFEQIQPTERYWYNVLFPKWFNEPEPKLFIWKQKMMAGKLRLDDEPLIKMLQERLRRSEGSALRRYVIDLSMATDLVVNGNLRMNLCVQLTTVSREFSIEKQQAWEVTLRYWGIQRGLFVSFNPGKQSDIVGSLADVILRQSDDLSELCYSECSVDD